MQKNESGKSAKEIVTEFMQAWEQKDWQTVRRHISDNISVLAPGPFKPNTFHQAEAYMYYLEHSNYPPREIKKVFVDGQDVCLLYEMNLGTPPVPLLVCLWAHVNDDGKISSYRVVFDPRPFVQR